MVGLSLSQLPFLTIVLVCFFYELNGSWMVKDFIWRFGTGVGWRLGGLGSGWYGARRRLDSFGVGGGRRSGIFQAFGSLFQALRRVVKAYGETRRNILSLVRLGHGRR